MLANQQLPSTLQIKPARLIEEHRQRRTRLRKEHRDALLAVDHAQREHAEALAAIENAESHALAFGGQGATPKHHKRVKAAEQAVGNARALAARTERAIALVDAEMNAVARDNYTKLRDELLAGHQRENEQLEAALGAAEVHIGALKEYAAALQNVMQAAGEDTYALVNQPRSLKDVMTHELPWPLLRQTEPADAQERRPDAGSPTVGGWMSGVNKDT